MSEIVTAVQRGSQVYVYGAGQRQLCAVFAGNGPEDGLKGYTSSTVSVRRGSNIYVYDPQGWDDLGIERRHRRNPQN